MSIASSHQSSSISNASNLSIGDFVSVLRNDNYGDIDDDDSTSTRANLPLKGVVAYIGEVHFERGSDLVGIRLTRESIGEGDNDGSVDGKRYFHALGPKSGLFARIEDLSKRKPTRLEELRLRRERKAAASSGNSTISSASSNSSSSSGRRHLTSRTIRSSASMFSSSPIESEGLTRVKKKMEQLRQGQLLGSQSSVISTTSSSTTVPTSNVIYAEKEKELEKLRKRIDSLTNQNEALISQHGSLKQELAQLRKKDASSSNKNGMEDKTNQILYVNTFMDAHIVDDASSPSMDDDKSTVIPVDSEMLSSLNQDIKRLKSKLQSTTSQLSETIKAHQTQSKSQQSQINTLQNQLIQTKTQLSSAASVSSADKQKRMEEKSKLRAENNTLKKMLEDLQKEKQNVKGTMSQMEMDLDKIKREKESLEDSLKRKKMEMDGTLMDMENMKIQMEVWGVPLDHFGQRRQKDHRITNSRQQHKKALQDRERLPQENKETIENSAMKTLRKGSLLGKLKELAIGKEDNSPKSITKKEFITPKKSTKNEFESKHDNHDDSTSGSNTMKLSRENLKRFEMQTKNFTDNIIDKSETTESLDAISSNVDTKSEVGSEPRSSPPRSSPSPPQSPPVQDADNDDNGNSEGSISIQKSSCNTDDEDMDSFADLEIAASDDSYDIGDIDDDSDIFLWTDGEKFTVFTTNDHTVDDKLFWMRYCRSCRKRGSCCHEFF